MAKTEDRFLRTYSQGSAFGMIIQIWVDRLTGVNYLYQTMSGAGGSLTPLLDREGKPIISPVPRQYDE